MSRTKILSLENLLPQDLEDEADLIPLMTTDDEEAIQKEPVPEELPILPLKNTVLFPGVVIPITASRDRSIKLIKAVNSGNKLLGVVAQQNGETKSPSPEDLYQKGTSFSLATRCSTTELRPPCRRNISFSPTVSRKIIQIYLT